jgi:hypothetical protein
MMISYNIYLIASLNGKLQILLEHYEAGDTMNDIHCEMRPWRAHLAKCREDDEKHYIGSSKEE